MKLNQRHYTIVIKILLGISILFGASIMALFGKSNQQAYGQVTTESEGQTPALSDGGVIVGGYQLSAQLDQDVVKSAEQIVLQIVVRNATQDKLSYLETHPGFNFEVTNEKGEVIPLTRYGKLYFRLPSENKSTSRSFRSVLIQLKRGEEKKYKFFINNLFDMSVPETYFVSAKKSVVVEGKTSEVVSNSVKVVVRPFQASQLPNKIPAGQEMKEE